MVSIAALLFICASPAYAVEDMWTVGPRDYHGRLFSNRRYQHRAGRTHECGSGTRL